MHRHLGQGGHRHRIDGHPIERRLGTPVDQPAQAHRRTRHPQMGRIRLDLRDPNPRQPGQQPPVHAPAATMRRSLAAPVPRHAPPHRMPPPRSDSPQWHPSGRWHHGPRRPRGRVDADFRPEEASPGSHRPMSSSDRELRKPRTDGVRTQGLDGHTPVMGSICRRFDRPGPRWPQEQHAAESRIRRPVAFSNRGNARSRNGPRIGMQVDVTRHPGVPVGTAAVMGTTEAFQSDHATPTALSAASPAIQRHPTRQQLRPERRSNIITSTSWFAIPSVHDLARHRAHRPPLGNTMRATSPSQHHRPRRLRHATPMPRRPVT